jgi:hypothetical protein
MIETPQQQLLIDPSLLDVDKVLAWLESDKSVRDGIIVSRRYKSLSRITPIAPCRLRFAVRGTVFLLVGNAYWLFWRVSLTSPQEMLNSRV